MPIAFRARRHLGLIMAGVICCALVATPASAIDTQAENVLIVSLREEAAGLELGNGIEKDPLRAAALYCEAARLGDMDSQFRLGWMYTNGSGVERSDATAAFFFQIAAEQGMEQAQHMLRVVGGPTTDVPDCMRAPAPAAKPATAVAAARPRPQRIAAPPNILNLVTKIAPQYQVEPQLALAIIEAESNFDTVALSPKNAKGLMQLIPATAARFNVRNPYDPAQNIRGGVAYLSWLLAYFEGDVSLVAAAYNAGEGAVERYRGVPPYRETRAYVQKVLHAVGTAVYPFDAKVTAPSPQLALIRQPGRWR
ncbi:transglycosylase SLT domain-containing protein [Piscinibacter sp. XHJ-5]|uniref:transglycosylase SLT domain-containing protein n=1 Tax=Piscinibacter sp. XHJ-5 TaxID=3037797 RepID=UPI002452BDC6|nr:transglycosylase SLT domain-containing protein [Piscinibacter sp. XHJ-5]